MDKDLSQKLDSILSAIGNVEAEVSALGKRVAKLEGGASITSDNSSSFFDEFQKRASEAVVTCVQCRQEYQESINGPGHCKYHPCRVRSAGWDYIFDCCNDKASDYESILWSVGCKSGKHNSKVHTEYIYHLYYDDLVEVKNKKLSSELWLEVERSDPLAAALTEKYYTNKKWVTIGPLKDGSGIAVIMGMGKYGMRVIEKTVKELETIGKNVQDFTILEMNSKTPTGLRDEAALNCCDQVKNWFAKAGWIIQVDKVIGIEVSLKTCVDSAPMIQKILFDSESLKLNEVKLIQDPPPRAVVYKEYKLPEKVKTGEYLPEDCNLKRSDLKIQKAVYSTSANEARESVKVKSLGYIKGASQWDLRGDQTGTMMNSFNVELSITNPSDEKPRALTEMTSEYLDSNGTWVPCQKTRLGYSAYNSVHFPDETSTALKLGAAETINIVVQGQIELKGKAGNNNFKRRRAHVSLPTPLTIRVTIEDSSDRKVSICAEMLNEPLGLMSLASQKKQAAKDDNSEDEVLFVFADDIPGLERHSWTMTSCEKKKEVYFSKSTGTNYTLEKGILEKMGYEAKAQAEWNLKDWTTGEEGEDLIMKATLLIDTEQNIPYAMKFFVETKDSKHEEAMTLPKWVFFG